ncbi:MAG: helix-turn-helix domain-containing protein [Kutzneria sp.]|nr:helix-turn-helix domain-containing protein [Kutzneria sp.]MBV9845208.1 helix-turn-helix domain-containing protein [Kutzneria sp.]
MHQHGPHGVRRRRAGAVHVRGTGGEPAAGVVRRDWTETVNDIVGGYTRDRGVRVERLTRQDRLALLARLGKAGVFSQRHSVPTVARAMRVGRSTIYQLLTEVRKEPASHADAS